MRVRAGIFSNYKKDGKKKMNKFVFTIFKK